MTGKQYTPKKVKFQKKNWWVFGRFCLVLSHCATVGAAKALRQIILDIMFLLTTATSSGEQSGLHVSYTIHTINLKQCWSEQVAQRPTARRPATRRTDQRLYSAAGSTQGERTNSSAVPADIQLNLKRLIIPTDVSYSLVPIFSVLDYAILGSILWTILFAQSWSILGGYNQYSGCF